MAEMNGDNSNKGYAVTVGFFDGVHKGHLHLIDTLRSMAAERGLSSRIVTFAEHPRQVLQSDFRPLLLSTAQDKCRMLEQCGADICTILHFTEELAMMDARSFMKDVLCDRLGAKCLLIGHDHRFGHDRITDFLRYREIGDGIGLEVIQDDALLYDEKPVSSSRIRHCLGQGDVESAAAMLGYQYSLTGTVVHGLRNGHRMGFPTANMELHCDMLQIPADGVYSAWATVGNETFKSMLNIGFRPTVNCAGGKRTIEAHLLDFDRDIYDEELTVRFVRYIRRERKFADMESLSAQLRRDRELISATL